LERADARSLVCAHVRSYERALLESYIEDNAKARAHTPS
jgi:hypothetical protein